LAEVITIAFLVPFLKSMILYDDVGFYLDFSFFYVAFFNYYVSQSCTGVLGWISP